jgi:putative spermidine/putrescine transport system ATP-binding protein
VAFLELKEITKSFGRFTAVDRVNLAVEQGEFLTLLGPSGCGKTTILRMVAGFETPSAGNILLEGENITHRAANKRPMGMVFQSYALFPHMTAEQNIAFGLSIRRQPPDVIKRRCQELLALVGLSDKGNSYPHHLSGGQQQRIAIARALAVEPKVLLLDEPLSALDAKVRVSLRNEIRRIQQQLKITAIYVTHDQEEALAISDRIAVIANGKIEQLDQPEEIYSNPRSIFAATFIGSSNRFNGVVESATDGLCRVGEQTFHVAPAQHLSNNQAVLLLVRPEEMTIAPNAKDETNHQSSMPDTNTIAGTIVLRTFLGPFTRFQVQINKETTLTADVPSQQARDFYVAQPVTLSFSPQACQVLPLDSSVQEVEEIVEA